MIKGVLKTIFAIGLVVGIMFLLAYSETHYNRIGLVKYKGGGLYTFKDETGSVWEFYANEIIPVNAHIQADFFTNNTLDNIHDDIIVDYKIIGYVDEISIDI